MIEPPLPCPQSVGLALVTSACQTLAHTGDVTHTQAIQTQAIQTCRKVQFDDVEILMIYWAHNLHNECNI